MAHNIAHQIHTDKKPIKVWDLPTRLFHWLFVASFIISFITQGDSRYLHFHVVSGYLFTGLLIFRLIWGLVGTHHARFKNFYYPISKVIDHVKNLNNKSQKEYIGHNPTGGWAIFLIILGSGLTAIFGLLVFGAQENYGPFASFFSFQQASLFSNLHFTFAWFTTAIVVIHITGVLVETTVFKNNVLMPMITGYKKIGYSAPSVELRWKTALFMVFVVMFFVSNNVKGYFYQTEDNPYMPYGGMRLEMSQQWKMACGECHLDYHPSLLPARSWKTLLEKQNDHFGEELDLENEDVIVLSKYAINNSAEQHQTEAAWFIDKSTPKTDVPLKITKTFYWKNRHQDIKQSVWEADLENNYGMCEACHFDAKFGTFEDSSMRLPKPKNQA